jgi:hypothetical protein
MSYSGGPENLTNNHTDEFNYPIYGINAGTTSITFSGDDASSTGSQWRTSFVDLLMSGSSTNSGVSGLPESVQIDEIPLPTKFPR